MIPVSSTIYSESFMKIVLIIIIIIELI